MSECYYGEKHFWSMPDEKGERHCAWCNWTKSPDEAMTATPTPPPSADAAPVDAAALLPCPFCAGTAKMQQVPYVDGDANAGAYFVSCDRCDACTCLMWALKEDCRPQLIERWNRRAALAAIDRAPQTDLIAQIREKVSEYTKGKPDNWDGDRLQDYADDCARLLDKAANVIEGKP